ncbi:LysR family transcriptional regulator [Acetobacter conturbans]|uniref:LysR family transcriptional regulator n=1 Tax=Acetobacter conturbans TaxID=1737472 RepID=UPI001F5585E2|nr:LysR family transcriptional regulator [Acetobacter conturbans]
MPPSRASTSRRPAVRNNGFQGRIAEVDLRLLRVFASVAEHGGFSAAEIALGKSKSAVSIDISSLEKRLNLTLCQRGRSGFALTPAGEAVLDATMKLFADLDSFQKRLSEASGKLSGHFVLYLPDTIQMHGETVLVRGIERFAKRYPEVYLTVRSVSPREVEFAVLNGTATAGITLYPQQRPEMETTPLFSEASALYCGQRHSFFSLPDEQITRADLTQARMITVVDAATSPRWEELRHEMTFSATAENVDSRTLLILSGVYIGFLPVLFAEPMVEAGQVRRISFDGLSFTSNFYLLARPSPENELMIDTFRAVLDEVSS